MKHTTQALIWAGVIIAAAIFSKVVGMGDAAAFAVTCGLTSAAFGSLVATRGRCSATCRSVGR